MWRAATYRQKQDKAGFHCCRLSTRVFAEISDRRVKSDTDGKIPPRLTHAIILTVALL